MTLFGQRVCASRNEFEPMTSCHRSADLHRTTAFLLLVAVSAFLSGCHSAYVTATVSNSTSKPVSLVQVDYPSASFGIQAIAPGGDFKYRFKVLGSGPMKITYTDAGEKEHKATGPILNEGNEGKVAITITDFGAHMQFSPSSPN